MVKIFATSLCEDLSLIPQHACEKAHACISNTGKKETGIPWDLLVSQSRHIGMFLSLK